MQSECFRSEVGPANNAVVQHSTFPFTCCRFATEAAVSQWDVYNRLVASEQRVQLKRTDTAAERVPVGSDMCCRRGAAHRHEWTQKAISP